MTNNLIRQLVKTIVGRFRTAETTQALYAKPFDAIAAENTLRELDARALEEFLISGCAVQKIEEQGGRCVITNVDMRRFFVNRFLDPRGKDIELVGMLHDMTLPQIIAQFGCSSRRRTRELRKLFGDISSSSLPHAGGIGRSLAAVDFFAPLENGRHRVVEIWTLDAREQAAGDRIDISFVWHCRWYATDGTLLREYDSPYAHGSHPFAVKYFPLTDGEVHSFVEDIIDQQRSINRLIVLIDHMMSASAKGVLLFPTSQLAPNVSWDDVVTRWSRADGVIPITGNGKMPEQVHTASPDSGAYQLLQLQMKLFEDISGVNDALLGRTTTARGADMLNYQIQTANIALSDIFETFSSFIQQRNAKMQV